MGWQSVRAWWRRYHWLVQLVFWLGVLLFTAITLYRDIDWATAWTGLQQTNLFWLAVAGACTLFSHVAKAARWQRLLGREPTPIAFRESLRLVLVGQGFNTFVPLPRIGDVARVVLLPRRAPAFTVGTLVLEKTLDLGCYALLGTYLVLTLALPATLVNEVTQFMVGTTVVLGVLVGSILIIARWPVPARVANSAMGRRLMPVLVQFRASWGHLRRRADLIALVGWSGLVWLAGIMTNACILFALDISVPVVSAVVLIVALQVGISLTSVPATLGIFEWVCIVVLGLFGVGEIQALTYGILLHLLILGPCLWGVLAARDVDIGTLRWPMNSSAPMADSANEIQTTA